MKDLFSLKGKVCVVTGALGLLGRQHCDAFAATGGTVIVTDMDDNKCREYAQTFDNAFGMGCDITDAESIQLLRNAILSRFGTIDVLVNNAAINDMFENPLIVDDASKFENYPLKMWQRSIDVNVTGTFLVSQILGAVMAQKGAGSIINIASTYGIVGPDQSIYIKEDGTQSFYKSPSYSATKGAVISFTRYLAAYWGTKGVRVNALSPGGVENAQDTYFIKSYSERTPLGRMALQNDYQGAIIFLASDASQYMTGANLIVDGGWTAI
jgi:NAD(P)-dependent dehydrogenase (short-subunit alcohol dehydrogenase family)